MCHGASIMSRESSCTTARVREVDRAQLPLAHAILDARFKSPPLLFLTGARANRVGDKLSNKVGRGNDPSSRAPDAGNVEPLPRRRTYTGRALSFELVAADRGIDAKHVVRVALRRTGDAL